MMFKKLSLFIITLALSAVPSLAQQANFNVVPLPQVIKSTGAGSFTLTEQTLICYPSTEKALKHEADLLAAYVKAATGLTLRVSNLPAQRNCIKLSTVLRHNSPEAYALRVNNDVVLLNGASKAGLFYAVQTFRKALPRGKEQQVVLPAVDITDFPRFAYRGAHLDVARHFITADSVKRFIDMLALHNLNRFHWHLTDDQGWRIEIKKYPLLTKVGAWRDATVIGHNSGKYDATRHGGFYTQKEIKDIVRYAQERHVTIIPEIDLPGHMQAALAAYPALGCTGGPYKVWQQWGVSDNVLCAGNDDVLRFITDVLDEVVHLFPSPYIHVGGDECPKTQWKACAKCQARIKAEHLEADGKHTAEERLQSYIIKYAEQHLNALGRNIIGWDETLEGGLAPNATVMSWRGEGGGIEAARQHHNVIMTPNTHLYFDYYQSDQPQNEPEAIGGYISLAMVYHYEPVPARLSADEQKYIIGVQANCWTEYMKSFRQVEYQELPRMAALGEIAWSAPKKNYDGFIDRLQRLVDVYRAEDYNYSKVIYNLNHAFTPDTAAHAITATLTTIDHAPIHYTLNGATPTKDAPLYTAPLSIDKSCTLRAAAFRAWGATPVLEQTFHFSQSTACPITLLQPSAGGYSYNGAPLLVNGVWGNDTNFKSGHWLGFNGTDLEAVIDLGKLTSVSRAAIHCIVEKGYWIFDARAFEVSVSTDGSTYQPVAVEQYAAATEQTPNEVVAHTLQFAPTPARYVKVKVTSEHSNPAWHPGKGYAGFLFVDEVEID